MLLAVVEQTYARISFIHDYTGRPINRPMNDNPAAIHAWNPDLDEPWDRPIQFTSGREVSAAAEVPIAAAATFSSSGTAIADHPLPGAGHLRGAAVVYCAPPFPITEAGVQSPFAGNFGGEAAPFGLPASFQPRHDRPHEVTDRDRSGWCPLVHEVN